MAKKSEAYRSALKTADVASLLDDKSAAENFYSMLSELA